jgi:hypothetical protein
MTRRFKETLSDFALQIQESQGAGDLHNDYHRSAVYLIKRKSNVLSVQHSKEVFAEGFGNVRHRVQPLGHFDKYLLYKVR